MLTKHSACPLATLRAATRAHHAHIEAHPLLRPLITGNDLDITSYVRILRAFLRYYRALETVLLPAWMTMRDASGIGYHYRRRTPLLTADLADLAVVPERTPPVPRGCLPPLNDRSSLLGVLYVVEGATRGGQVAAPRLARDLGLDRNRGARFFGLDTEPGSGAWPAFVTMLRARHEPDTLGRMTAAARAVFDGLHRCLEQDTQRTVEDLDDHQQSNAV